ncbi:hypothetical protein Tco_1049381, partial [Tanacetum coccineum]
MIWFIVFNGAYPRIWAACYVEGEQKEENNKSNVERKENDGNQNNGNKKIDNDGFVPVQNKKQNPVYGKVLRPNFKPNIQQYRGGNQRGNMNGKGEPKFAFQPKKKVNENVVPKELDIIPKTTTTMRRSANKFSVFEKYDENETNKLQSIINREAVEKKRIAEISEKEVTSGSTQEVNDVFPDVSGMARCMEEDSMNGMDDGILNEFLETHIKSKKHKKVGDSIFGSWNWISNMQNLLNAVRVTVAHVFVNAAQLDLLLR